MMHDTLLSRKVALAFALVVLSVASCTPDLPGSAALSKLEIGAFRANVMDLLPPGGMVAPPDRSPFLVLDGYWRDQYLIEGKSVEVVWVHDPAQGFPSGDLRIGVNPVVFVDDRLDGWGWEYFDGRREEWKLMDRPSGASPPDEGAEQPSEERTGSPAGDGKSA
ncbi:MAG: hypothetical protein EXR92_03440 [Gemmatimonadetes bacterium]|nr:hypothetical protein [Gemmatimonadota bacterium]